METFLQFLIRASVYLLVFSGGYYLLLRQRATPAANRFFILGSFLGSLLLAGLPGSYVAPLAADPSGGAIILPEVILRASEGSAQVSNLVAGTFSGKKFLAAGLLLFSLLLLLISAVNLLRIFWLTRYNPSIRQDDMQVILFSTPISPFSFFRWVFVPQSIVRQEHFPRVLAHERAHFRRGHSWDILFMEVMRVLFWYHPAFYFLRKELKAQHEFEADQLACLSIRKTDYQLTLLEYTLSGTLVPLTNPFNVSLIKKRIMMMNRSTNLPTSRIWLKAMLLIPFLALAVAVQSCQETAKDEALIEATAADETIYTVVDQHPQFPGGEEARIRFMQENLRYPKPARDAGEQGTVFVTFVIRHDGSIEDVKVLRGVSESLDAEAVRVIEKMPAWTPGYKDGQAVNVQFNIPIRYVLPEESNHVVIVVE
jgi:TonB family protein